MNATLTRIDSNDERTLGLLRVGGQVYATLERPWRQNARNVSCIPAGQYDCEYLPRSASGKYRQVWHVLGVPDRGGILIHNGNTVSHTRGCILVGLRHGVLAGASAVLNSRTAMRKLLAQIGEAGMGLTVQEHGHA